MADDLATDRIALYKPIKYNNYDLSTLRSFVMSAYCGRVIASLFAF